VSTYSNETSLHNRGFLLGMTLNELVFLLFFLLVLVSTHLLQSKNELLTKKATLLQQLQNRLSQKQAILDETFRKLGILQNTIDRLHELQPHVQAGELDEQFKRLVESENQIRIDNETLRKRLKELDNLSKLYVILKDAGYTDPPDLVVRQLLLDSQNLHTQKLAAGKQVKSTRTRYSGNGLDHRPCWTNPNSGAIEYLFRITIFEDYLQIEPAWPEHRNDKLISQTKTWNFKNRRFTPPEFKRLATPILSRSKQQRPECRHFVRIHDHSSTSKSAFKKHLRMIENYFYKYLEAE